MIRITPFTTLRPTTRIDNVFFTSFMPMAPEGYVKVYLYALMLSEQGGLDADIAGALGLSEGEVSQAMLYWQQQGLLRVLPGDVPAVEFLEYLPEGRFSPARKADACARLFTAMQDMLGSRILSVSELQRVRDWVEVYGLDEAAVLMLVRHCIETNERGRGVSVNYMDAVARRWADTGVKSAAEAEDFLSQSAAARSGAIDVLKRLGKQRPPTADELGLYEAWMQRGFSKESVLLACSELTAYGTPSFKALDNVLDNCRRNGLTSVAAMEEYLKKNEQSRAFVDVLFSRLGLTRQPSRADRETIALWRTEWRMTDELLLLAADCARGESQRFAACKRLLTDWYNKGITRTDDAREDFERAKNAAPLPKKSKAFAYLQREQPQQDASFVVNFFDE
ncbi:MAG: DnaD domain protein [Clostridia bacterium]|nr:DnaD domain protein [Clostridia bacterium]